MADSGSDSGCDSGWFVPRVDLSLPDSEICDQLTSALTTVGFVCLTNTSVWDKAQEYGSLSQSFFDLNLEEKLRYERPIGSVDDNAGWVAVGREKLSAERPGDYKECFNMMRYVKGDRSRVPESIDNAVCWELWEEFSKLSHRVLRLIGQGLKLQDADFLSKTHHFDDTQNNQSELRVAWYPKILNESEMKSGQIRCGEHSDYGSITLLYANSPGLQVLNRLSGEYEDAGFVEGGIFVNLGDMLQMWSGDVLSATKHRVLTPEREFLSNDRTSVIFFCLPDDEILIETLDGSAKYPPVLSHAWLEKQFALTYDVAPGTTSDVTNNTTESETQ